jgi:hypothetical protein
MLFTFVFATAWAAPLESSGTRPQSPPPTILTQIPSRPNSTRSIGTAPPSPSASTAPPDPIVLSIGIVVPVICLLALVIVIPIAVNRRTRPLGLEESWNDPTRYTIDSGLQDA